jgi:hypothetical protein
MIGEVGTVRSPVGLESEGRVFLLLGRPCSCLSVTVLNVRRRLGVAKDFF